MKNTNLTLVVLACALLSTNAPAAWFGNEERERRIQAEEQVQEQQKEKARWQIVASGLAVGCVVLLTIGAAIGATVRRHGNL